MEPEVLNGATLAYLGDAVLEIMVREKVIESGVTDVGRLNNMARTFVRATEQSSALNNILEILDEEEMSFFKRGRNTKGNTPKSASAIEYRRATGLEALFAFLYMKGRTERMKFLFETAYKDHFEKILNQ
ncbi:MAG: ribonuclease III [Ruminococcaceae bacterium]|nr:ribonuclease III [Oscillospiraceae bacterium]